MTRGGANKGRVQDVGEDRFTIITDAGGRKHELLFSERVNATAVAEAELITPSNRASTSRSNR